MVKLPTARNVEQVSTSRLKTKTPLLSGVPDTGAALRDLGAATVAFGQSLGKIHRKRQGTENRAGINDALAMQIEENYRIAAETRNNSVDGKDYAATFETAARASMGKTLQAVRGKFSFDADGDKALEAALNSQLAPFLGRAHVLENDMRVSSIFTGLDKNIQQLANTAFAHPEDFPEHMRTIRDMIANHSTGDGKLPTKLLEKAREAMEKIPRQAILGLVDQGRAEEALGLLTAEDETGKGLFDEFFDGDEKASLVRTVKAARDGQLRETEVKLSEGVKDLINAMETDPAFPIPEVAEMEGVLKGMVENQGSETAAKLLRNLREAKEDRETTAEFKRMNYAQQIEFVETLLESGRGRAPRQIARIGDLGDRLRVLAERGEALRKRKLAAAEKAPVDLALDIANSMVNNPHVTPDELPMVRISLKALADKGSEPAAKALVFLNDAETIAEVLRLPAVEARRKAVAQLKQSVKGGSAKAIAHMDELTDKITKISERTETLRVTARDDAAAVAIESALHIVEAMKSAPQRQPPETAEVKRVLTVAIDAGSVKAREALELLEDGERTRDEIVDFLDNTIGEQNAEILTLLTGADALEPDARDAEQIDRDGRLAARLIKVQKNLRKNLETNPMSTAQSARIIEKVAPIDLSKPETLLGSFRERLAQGERIEQVTGLKIIPFDENEIELIDNLLRDATPGQTAFFLNALVDGIGEDRMAMLAGKFKTKRPFLAAAVHHLSGGKDNLDLAREIIDGGRVWADPDNANLIPPSAFVRSAMTFVFGNMFGRAKEVRGVYQAAGIAVYMARINENPPAEGGHDPEAMYDAMRRGAGAAVGPDGQAEGGVVEYKGRVTLTIEPDDNAAAIQNTMDKLTDEMTVLYGNGVPVDRKGRVQSAKVLAEHGQLIPLGNGRYMIEYENLGAVLVRQTPVGPDAPYAPEGAYIIDLKKFRKSLPAAAVTKRRGVISPFREQAIGRPPGKRPTTLRDITEGGPETEVSLERARTEAEARYPFIKNFSHVAILPAIPGVENKSGLGEFVGPGDPGNPTPGELVITVGRKSKHLKGGVADTVIADMVHAASEFSPEFKALKEELIGLFTKDELALARKRYDNDYKGKFTGSNFESFDSFLETVWADGVVQHLLLPEKSEIESFKRTNPRAALGIAGETPVLERIEKLFLSDPEAIGGSDPEAIGGAGGDPLADGATSATQATSLPSTPRQMARQDREIGDDPSMTISSQIGRATRENAEAPAEVTKLGTTDVPKVVVTAAARGIDAVREAVAIVDQIFPGAETFLLRVAAAESRNGHARGTFTRASTGGSMGIWQTDRNTGFAEGKNVRSHPNLAKAHRRIQDVFGINWNKVDFLDLNQPLMSALAARLYLLTIPDAIPSSLEDQAKYWKRFYNTEAGKGTIEHFIGAAGAAGVPGMA